MSVNAGQRCSISKNDIHGYHYGRGQFNVDQYYNLILAVSRMEVWNMKLFLNAFQCEYAFEWECKCKHGL